MDLSPLDNPIWSALTTAHAPLAEIHGSARRYPSAVSPLAALETPSAQAFADLQELVAPDESVGLFTCEAIVVPPAWELVRTRTIDQMICTEPRPYLTQTKLQSLGEANVPEMLLLTAATQPGPFLPETIRMGEYLGIRTPDGRLAAMAGVRLQLERFVELSAVCTDPVARGAGFATALVTELATNALAKGRSPFLHVKSELTAKTLYEKLGFRVRSLIHLTVVRQR